MEQNREVRIAYANAVVDKLWMKGLITDEERIKIKKLNDKNIN
jgi:hypothetical protein